MDFHILTQAKDQNTINVVFHIPVPVGNNEVGISWRDAVVKEQGEIISVLPDIDPAELTLMQSGALIEKVENVRFSSIFLSNTQRLQQVKDRYAVVKIELIAEKQITLAFMGYGGDV